MANSDRLEAFLNVFRNAPHHLALGIELTDISPASASARLPYQPQFVGNPITGVVHGGVVTTLLDTVGGVAVMTALDAKVTVATLDLRIDYLRPSHANEDIFATVSCYKITTHVAFARGTAFNGDPDDPIAAMSATFALNSRRNRRPPQTSSNPTPQGSNP